MENPHCRSLPSCISFYLLETPVEQLAVAVHRTQLTLWSITSITEVDAEPDDLQWTVHIDGRE